MKHLDIIQNTLIIGAGGWGTALACHFARICTQVHLFTRNVDVCSEIEKYGTNSLYLPNVKLPKNILPQTRLDLSQKSLIVIVVPSSSLNDIICEMKNLHLCPQIPLLIATKGLESNPSQLISDKIRSVLKNPIAFAYGPNFALEVAQNLLTHITIASENIHLLENLKNALSTDQLVISTTTDIITVQVASAIKNVIAIQSGLYDALGYKENAKAALITSGLQEIAALSKAMGGSIETVMQAAVIGDLVLTAYSKTSRNTKFGYALGLNKNNQSLAKEELVEGILSGRLVLDLARQYNVHLPLTESIVRNYSKNIYSE